MEKNLLSEAVEGRRSERRLRWWWRLYRVETLGREGNSTRGMSPQFT
jgi:hypothetical protein